MRVNLYTRDGGFVVAGVLLPFNEAPEVLLWGQRVFRYCGLETGSEVATRYEEAWTTVLLPEQELP